MTSVFCKRIFTNKLTKSVCRNCRSPREGTFLKPKAENSYLRADDIPVREERVWGRANTKSKNHEMSISTLKLETGQTFM